jgi:hypothetical protein
VREDDALEIPWSIRLLPPVSRSRSLADRYVHDDNGWTSVRPFLARNKDRETGGDIAMPYPVIIATPAMAKQYNITSMPVTLLIDRQRKIAFTHRRRRRPKQL